MASLTRCGLAVLLHLLPEDKIGKLRKASALMRAPLETEISCEPTWQLERKGARCSGASLVGPVVKNLPSDAGHVGSIPGWGKLRSHMP